MDAPANIVSLPSPAGRPPIPGSSATSLPPVGAPAGAGIGATRVSVERDRVVVERLVLVDASLAAFVAERPAEERAGLVERALKIGMTALMDAGVTVNVDAVRAEFAGLLRQTEESNAKAAAALDQLLRQNFADGDGRLPRTLEAFLGDRGKLRSLTDELFDESKRDSAIGRIKTLLGTYIDGDGSKLATLLDPTRLGSPLFQFRGEITEGFTKLNERIAALEAASTARAQERAKGTAKGGDFEDLLEGLLAEGARGAGDLLDRTAAETGAVLKSRKGDFVLTLDPGATRGHDVRVVVEAKDRPHVDAGHPRGAPRGEGEPRRGGRGHRLHAGPRAGGHRPLHGPRRRRLLRRRPGGARAGLLRGGHPAWPGCWRSRRSTTARSRSTRRPSRGPSRACASSSMPSPGSRAT